MPLVFELSGNFLSMSGAAKPESRMLTGADFATLADWSARYRMIRADKSASALAPLGAAMFTWLNGTQKWLESQFQSLTGDFAVEFRTPPHPSADERLFLDAPWELLGDGSGLLAERSKHAFCVARRLGPAAKPMSAAPGHSDVAALFMAAAVEGQTDLDYEAEEIAIIDATSGLDLSLAVEDSGGLAPLGERIKLEGALDVVHLSGHGDLAGNGGSLILETDTGEADAVNAERLRREAFGDELPPLIFLSACHSAEAPRDGGSQNGAQDVAMPLAVELVQAGFPAVLGWSGPVLDTDATRFAREFYAQLVHGRNVAAAAAHARQILLKHDGCEGRDWHLARVYLGPEGGAPLCTAGARTRPKGIAADHGHQEILQTRLASGEASGAALVVASRRSFVGRRRETQAILRAFKAGDHAGVLIHGQGRRGKTSLAARIANRMSWLKPVVIFDNYRASAIFDEVLKACDPAAQSALEAQWSAPVRDDPAKLRLALEAMLTGPLAQGRPILLIVDDLERALDAPALSDAPTTVQTDYVAALRAIIEAFANSGARTKSRLLLTSRYTFTLPDAKGRELARHLHALQLPPMRERERAKQMQARLRLDGKPRMLDIGLQARCIAAAIGNPGLQEMLTGAVLEDAAAAEAAIKAMERYLADGTKPLEQKTAVFLENLLLDTLLKAVDADGRALLCAGTLFAIPVPQAVFEAAAGAVGIGAEDCRKRMTRLAGLSLLDGIVADLKTGERHWHVPRLARPMLLACVRGAKAPPPACPLLPGFDPGPVALTGDDQGEILRAVLPVLEKLWRDAGGEIGMRPEALELTRLAELAGNWPLLSDAAASAAFWLQSAHRPHDAARIANWALQHLESKGAHPGVQLLRIGATLARQFGDGDGAKRLLERGLTASEGGTAQAMLWADWGTARASHGDPDEALRWLEKARDEFQRLGDVRSRAVTMGKIADILQARGDLDEALRIRREEELPVYDRLGDVRERAVTMGKIADILQARGELDEALRIRREEQLPVFDRLGDVRERAVTMGKIADILQARGELDEALRIRREEQLPVYDRLGDVRERAVTMGQIADILQARGELDEALRIRREEQLPVYDRLGDVRSRAVTMGKIADIDAAQGRLDQAITGYELACEIIAPLGAIARHRRVSRRIADILRRAASSTRHCASAARSSCRSMSASAMSAPAPSPWAKSPTFCRRAASSTRPCASAARRSCRSTSASAMSAPAPSPWAKSPTSCRRAASSTRHLRIRREEQLPVYDRLGDVRSRAVTMGKIADILQARGELDEALRIRREEELPVYERLGDVRSRAVTMGKIADILQARGELDEALRIRREEQLPVYDRLGDVRSRAVTMGKIADILQARGELDEALRIRREEELPVYERLGDVRSRAVTMGKIADILQARGELDEALRIRREEELPVYERLGDVRSRAVTMGKIADILQARGELDEALRIHEEERQPIAEKLGDVDSLIHIWVKTSRIRVAKGIDSQETFERVLGDLGQAYQLAKRLTRLDFICAAASDLAQLLMMAGAGDQARPLLAEARDGYAKLGLAQHAAQMDAWLAQLGGTGA